ncbi:MAG: amino acid adenylation domain-containing protein [Actinomycetota bacterium]|nr:amino acid adenylation domain-containing protein [Actinomycetota bacterium]
MSPLQEGMLFHALFDENALDVYTNQIVLDFEGLDTVRLRIAAQALLDRHSCLRIAFPLVNDQPMQVVAHKVQVTWAEVDLSDLPIGDRSHQRDRLVENDRITRFDLQTPPLLRFLLLKTGETHHRLVMSIHHILLDGWSLSLMQKELFTLYASHGDSSALPDVRPFHDHLKWLSTRDREAALAAWAQALKGIEQPTLLAAADRSRPLIMPERVDAGIFENLTSQLTSFARAHGLTLNTLVQVAWAVVLSRLVGRLDVVFGMVVAGRSPELSGFESMLGMFMNTVPVRVRLDPAESLVDLLHRIQDEQFQLLDYQYVGLAELQRQVGVDTLFDTLTVIESFHSNIAGMTQALEGTGVTFTLKEIRSSTHYPIALVVWPGARLRIDLEYRPDLFDVSTAEALIDRVVQVLELMVTVPDIRVSGIDVLSAKERDQLLIEWNDTAVETEKTTLLELLTAQVARTPNAVAVVCGEESVTYAELDERACRLADHLIMHGSGPEQVVGVCLDRSVDLVVALLGVLRTGAAFVAVEPQWPAARIQQVCQSAGMVALVTALAMRVGPAGVMRVDIDNLPEPRGLELCRSKEASVPVEPEGLAYVIFTSGSTGTPKGVMIRHVAIAARLLWQRELLGFGSGDAVLFKAPLGFDIAINEIFLPLVSGARLVVAEPGGERDIEYLLTMIERERVTFVYLVSSMLDMLLELSDVTVRAQVLKHVWCGGEALGTELFNRFRATLNAVMYHGYGPAEATIGVTHQLYRPGQSRDGITIGRPNPNTQIYLLDEGLRPVPIGVTGELYVGGLLLGRGYVNDPAQTALRFVADPFHTGERLYRTGDLARWRPNGILEFCGRADNQVKIRGMRVELGEVEAVLAKHPQIRQAVVTIDIGPSGTTRLIGYCLITHEYLDYARLRTWAATRLPEHMVPTTFVTLDTIPLTPNGKINRQALPSPDRAQKLSTSRVPVSAREQILCELFAEVLGLPEVGVDDDFFTLGGDSIIAMQLVNRARKRHLAINPRWVFQRRTPAALAALGEDMQPVTTQTSDQDRIGSVFLLPIVQRLSEQSGPIKRFNQHTLVRVPAAADLASLGQILQAVLDRHDGLRLRLTRHAPAVWSLETTAEGSVQAVDLLRRIDVVGLDTAALRMVIAAESDAATGRLDPDAGIMLQAVWFDAGRAEQGRLLVVAHHLVIDGVSWRILLEDFVTSWEAVRAGEPPELRVGTSLRTFARIFMEQAQASHRLSELEHWVQTLSSGGELLREFIPAGTVSEIRHHDIHLPVADTVSLLTSVPAAAGAEVTDVLVAALRMAVSRWHERHGRDGSRDLLVDLERHGREEIAPGVDLSRTVGWFTSIAPVRLPASPDVLSALKAVKERLHVMPDGGIGYGMLRYANSRTAPMLAKFGQPQVVFNYLGRFDIGQQGEWTLAPEFDAVVANPDAEMGVSHQLTVDAICIDTPEGPQLQATFRYLSTALSARDAYELADAWATALRELVVWATTSDDRSIPIPSWPEPLPPLTSHCGDNILLTGATGFFGAFLLREILAQYQGTVHCLVRAESTMQAWDKLRTNLRRYRLSEEILFQNRIRIVVGDLSLPRLGLGADDYEYLADKIDLIIHNGAIVNVLYSYETVEAVNVGGTRELLRLAATTWRKPLRLVSTHKTAEYRPSVSGDEPGYLESKWRAEQIVAEARAHGIPAAVYRVPRLTGDSLTGICNDRDITVHLTRSVLDLGIAPDFRMSEEWIPVDEAARLLVSPYPGPEHGDSFVLTTPRRVCLLEIIETARQIGYEIEYKSIPEWCHEAASRSVEQYEMLALTLSIYSAESMPDEDISAPSSEEPPGDSIPIIARGVTDQILHRYLHTIKSAKSGSIDMK